MATWPATILKVCERSNLRAHYMLFPIPAGPFSAAAVIVCSGETSNCTSRCRLQSQVGVNEHALK